MGVWRLKYIYLPREPDEQVTQPYITVLIPVIPIHPTKSVFHQQTLKEYDLSYLINWGCCYSGWTMTQSYNSGDTAYLYHSYSSAGTYTVTAYAISQDGVWSSPSYYTITISQPPPTGVSIDAYDLANGSYLDNIPVQIDGSWYSSGSAINLPTGYYTFQAPDADGGGAFNCFYDGSNYYGNGASIPISGDETITALYNYLPTYTVTFDATDPSYYPVYTDVYINNNWVGTTDWNTGNLTIALPLGVYPLSDDQYAYDPLYGQAMPLGMSVYPGYPGFVDGNGNLWVVGDTSVWLLYYY